MKHHYLTTPANAETLISELTNIPDYYALTPIGGKVPYRKGWQSEKPYSKDQIKHFITNGSTEFTKESKTPYTRYPTGYAVRLGDISKGIIAIDIDGSDADDLLSIIVKDLTQNTSEFLPDTVSWTSGKEGRRQLLFQLPSDYQAIFKSFTRKVITTYDDITISDGLEIRYNTCTSVLPPSIHPETEKPYFWINSPSDTEISILPSYFCDFLIRAFNIGTPQTKTQKHSDNAIKKGYFDLRLGLSVANQNYCKTGFKEGGRNSGIYNLLCDAKGVADYLEDRGVNYQPTLDELAESVGELCDPPCSDPRDRVDVLRILESVNTRPRKPCIGYSALNEVITETYGRINTKTPVRSQLDNLETDIKLLNSNARNAHQKFLGLLNLSTEYSLHINSLVSYSELVSAHQQHIEEVSLFAPDMLDAVDQSKRRLKMLEILPIPLAGSIDGLAEAMGVASEGVFTCLLPSLASLMGGKARVNIKKSSGYVEYPIIRAINVGESGDLKTAILKNSTEFLNNLDNIAFRKFGLAKKKYQEDLAEWEKTPKKDRGDKPLPPVPKQYIIEDKTTESLYKVLEHNQELGKQGILVSKDEYSGEFKSFDKYRGKGDDKELDMQLFNGTRIRRNRITDDVNQCIERPVVSKTGGIQWSALIDLISKVGEDDSQGYLARHLFNCTNLGENFIELLDENPVHYHAKDNYLAITTQLGYWIDQSLADDLEFDLSTGAKAAFQLWQHESQRIKKKALLTQFGTAIPKLQTYLARFALILHVIEAFFTDSQIPDKEISQETMLKAIEITNFYMSQMKLITYKGNRQTGDILAIKETIDKYNKVTISSIKSYNTRFRKYKNEELIPMFDLLVSLGQIVKLDSPHTQHKYGSLARYGNSLVSTTAQELDDYYLIAKMDVTTPTSREDVVNDDDIKKYLGLDQIKYICNRLTNQQDYVLTSELLEETVQEFLELEEEELEVEEEPDDILTIISNIYANPDYQKYWELKVEIVPTYNEYSRQIDKNRNLIDNSFTDSF